MTKVVATHNKDQDDDAWKLKYDDFKNKPDSWLTEQKYYVSSKVVKWINVRPFSSEETICDSRETTQEKEPNEKTETTDLAKDQPRTRELIHGFCESTTAHGWAHVIRSTNSIYNRLWLLVTLGAICGAGVHLFHLTSSYLEYKYTESSIQTRNLPEFPFITICNQQGINVHYTLQQGDNKSSPYNTKFIPMVKNVKHVLSRDRSKYNKTQIDYVINEVHKLRTLYANMGTDATKYGYQIQEMLISCIHSGHACNAEDFTKFEHPDYFNCYTYKGAVRISTSTIPGPQKGLSMVLYGDYSYTYNVPYERDNPVANAQGMRIVIHAPGTLPNINENGINILPGQSTSLRITMNKINHIDEPYSSCYDPPEKRSTNTLQTDLNSCRKMCLDKVIAKNCSCKTVDHTKKDKYKDLPVCAVYDNNDAQKVIDDILCYIHLDVPEHYIVTLICECYWFCEEIIYNVRKSESKWPRANTLTDFLSIYVKENVGHYANIAYSDVMNVTTHERELSHGIDAEKDLLDSLHNTSFPSEMEQNWVYNNFFHLNVFFRDMVVVEHMQEPAFTLVDFCSNIGGVFGLWGGVSLLTLLEIITFLSRLFHHLCCRKV